MVVSAHLGHRHPQLVIFEFLTVSERRLVGGENPERIAMMDDSVGEVAMMTSPAVTCKARPRPQTAAHQNRMLNAGPSNLSSSNSHPHMANHGPCNSRATVISRPRPLGRTRKGGHLRCHFYFIYYYAKPYIYLVGHIRRIPFRLWAEFL
jgi:hypothetical protein